MAVVKPRTAAVIVVTVIVAAVFSLVLLPRWQAARAVNPAQPSVNDDKLLLTKLDEPNADSEAMWNLQDQSETAANGVPTGMNSRKPIVGSVPDVSDSRRYPNLPPPIVGPKTKSREVFNVIKKVNEKIDEEAQPQSAEENTRNAKKYEKLRTLLHQMHAPQADDTVDFRNSKPKLSKVSEKEALKRLVEEHHQQEGLSPAKRQIDARPPRLGSDDGEPNAPPPKGDIMTPRIPSRPTTSQGLTSTSPRHGTPPTSQPLTTSTPSPPRTPPTTTPNPRKDLPSMRRGSVVITPERLPPPANSADIYYSLLTAPAFHNLRFSLQYLTWLQTLDPKQVNVVTDRADNEWIQAFKEEGGNIWLPQCPLSTRKTREMMCCKTGAQFDYWYRAKEAGMDYKWYCHFDDDLYVNPQALANLLSNYDPTTDQYLGAWAVVGRVHRQNRIPGNMLAPKLHTYAERKRDDFRYANGPSYCISEALMMRVEKYLRGKHFEENCRKSDAAMDDVLPGVIIDGVLGIDLKDIPGFKSQLDFMLNANSQEMKKKAQDIVSIGFGRFTISDGRFDRGTDTKGAFSYHCLLHPNVSWCQR